MQRDCLSTAILPGIHLWQRDFKFHCFRISVLIGDDDEDEAEEGNANGHVKVAVISSFRLSVKLLLLLSIHSESNGNPGWPLGRPSLSTRYTSFFSTQNTNVIVSIIPCANTITIYSPAPPSRLDAADTSLLARSCKKGERVQEGPSGFLKVKCVT